MDRDSIEKRQKEREQFTAELRSEFPSFFNDSFSYVEISSGWFPLVYSLTKAISQTENLPKDFRVLQVKQKFGSLCYYVTNLPKPICKLIRKAENDSEKICEECGEPGELGHYRGYGYIEVLCKKHIEEFGDKK